jgi:hypothetical protein
MWTGLVWLRIGLGGERRALANAIMNLWAPLDAGKLLSYYTTGGPLHSAQVHRVSIEVLYSDLHYFFSELLLSVSDHMCSLFSADLKGKEYLYIPAVRSLSGLNVHCAKFKIYSIHPFRK